MATVPDPITWATGQKLTGTSLNGLRDALNFLLDTPHAHIYNASGVAIPNNAATRLTFPDTISDNDGMAASPGRLKFNTTGTFLVNLFLDMPPATYTTLNLQVRLNSGGSATGGSTIRTFNYTNTGGEQITISFYRGFTAGDYIEPYVTQNSGSSRTAGAPSLATGIQGRWVGV